MNVFLHGILNIEESGKDTFWFRNTLSQIVR